MRKSRTCLKCLVLLSAVMSFSIHAATITVNSLADDAVDDGECTLREAITAANSNSASGAMVGECPAGEDSPVLDVIEFSVAGTIFPDSQLPTINTQIHINGYSAPGALKNTNPSLSQGTNAVLKIWIDGGSATTGSPVGNFPGLQLSGAGASGSIIEGLVISNSANPVCCAQGGIFLTNLSGTDTTIIRGNFIGTNDTGTARFPKGAISLFLQNPANNVLVGSDPDVAFDPGAVNLISGNNAGAIVTLNSKNAIISGNLIGTSADGANALHNQGTGILSQGGKESVISGNVISGNNGIGIQLDTGSADWLIESNLIGSDAGFNGPIPNGLGGIRIAEATNTPGQLISNIKVNNNIVAYNNCAGCSGGIMIGNRNSASTTTGVRLAQNTIFANQGLEIDLAEANATNNGYVFGVTPNDDTDPDTGPNGLQNFPVITSANGDGSQILVDFELNSEPNTSYTVDFYFRSICDESGYGGAQSYLGDEGANTNPAGIATGQTMLPTGMVNGFITATATSDTTNNTSEFSACFPITELAFFEDGFEEPPP